MLLRKLCSKHLLLHGILQNAELTRKSQLLPCGYGCTIKRFASKFAGKNVIYVGGYGGIGFAVSKLLMCKGIKVTVSLLNISIYSRAIIFAGSRHIRFRRYIGRAQSIGRIESKGLLWV